MGTNGPVVKQRGRRPSVVRMRRFVVTLSLHPVLDAELIAALEHTPKGGRARLIREWLRSGPVPNRETADTADVPDLEELGIEF